jgi:hypothetical protein
MVRAALDPESRVGEKSRTVFWANDLKPLISTFFKYTKNTTKNAQIRALI